MQTVCARESVKRLCMPLLWTGIAVLLWGFWTTAFFAALAGGAFLYALVRRRGAWRAWRNPAGLAFALVLVWTGLCVPFSVSPRDSLRDAVRLLPALAGAAAIPAVFNSRARLGAAMLHAAAGVTLILAGDLVRLWIRLGPDLISRARLTEPYAMNHPNVASIMAAAAVFVLAGAAWSRRHSPWRAALAASGAALNLAYVLILASRGPQIAFAAAIAAAGFMLPGRRARLAWLLLIVLGGALLASNIERVNRRFASGDVGSLNDRTKVWAHTWKLARERPFSGHGFGKRTFQDVYYASDPPASPYFFPHPHNYWLKALFESGWIGVGLHAAAWGLLALRLARRLSESPALEERLPPGTLLALLLLVHVYGLGDYPDEMALIVQLWLVPAALVATVPLAATRLPGPASSSTTSFRGSPPGKRRRHRARPPCQP